jgi:vacuolar-type H+-ATPase subunit H
VEKVPMLQEWLRRFRLSGVPGAPATAGVPRDKTSSLEDELRPLLVQLGDAEQRTRAIEERFDTGNRRLLDDAKTSAEKLIAEARVRAGSERDRAIAEETAAAERERSDLLRDAEAEAGRVREQSARELEGLVDKAVSLVLAGEGRSP